VTAVDKSVAEANRGLSATPSYLWTRNTSTTLEPIVEIKILFSSSTETPKGFEKLNRNILKGFEDKEAYLCYRRDKNETPIKDIFITYENNFSAKNLSFEMISDPVYSNEKATIRLVIVRATKTQSIHINSSEVKSGGSLVINLPREQFEIGSKYFVDIKLLDKTFTQLDEVDSNIFNNFNEIENFWTFELVIQYPYIITYFIITNKYCYT
jgi:hypothetical protein